jgi:hypothetical protein
VNIHEALQLQDKAEILSLGPVRVKRLLDSKTAKNGKKHRGIFIEDDSGETLIRIWDDVNNGLLKEGSTVQFASGGGSVTINEWNDKKSVTFEGGDINRIDGADDSPKGHCEPPPSTPSDRQLSMEEWAEYQAVMASCSIGATQRHAEVWQEALGEQAATELRLRLAAGSSDSASKAWTGTKYLKRKKS